MILMVVFALPMRACREADDFASARRPLTRDEARLKLPLLERHLLFAASVSALDI